LDDTLLRPDKTVSERTLRALRSCLKKGIRLIIATGRALASGEKYRELIGMGGPHVYYNGAEVADVSAGKVVYTKFVDPRPILYCVRLARQMGLYYQVFFPAGTVDAPSRGAPHRGAPRRGGQGSGEVLMAERITAEAEMYTKSSNVEVTVGDLEEQLAKVPAVIKGMFITAEENQARLRSLLEGRYGDSIYITRSSPAFLETLAAGVSKGAGLSHALEYLNLKAEDTVAFGDEENDLPLFEAAGFSAAPANAKDKVLHAATFRIPANAEDGVAVFLEERFNLDC